MDTQPLTPTYQILCGDARAKLAELDTNSVQVFVTSIPYWGMRRYIDHPDEIGREETLEDWIRNLVEVFDAARRPLRPDGTLWINCGDGYASNVTSDRLFNSGLTGRHDLNPDRRIPAYQIGLKSKDLLGLAWHIAFALQADGWYLRSAIPWCKGVDWLDGELEARETIRDALEQVRREAAGSLFGLSAGLAQALDRAERALDRVYTSGSVMPESTTDRPVSAYEMLFLFSQRERYYFDQHAIKVPASPLSNSRGNGHTPKETDEGSEVKAKSSFHETTKFMVKMRSARNVWMIPWRTPVEAKGTFRLSSGKEIAHFAAYPQALVERVIKASTPEAGCCATCGAPFERLVSPTPEYAQYLGHDWADYDQDQAEGRGHFDGAVQRPVKRVAPKIWAEYVTVGWVPTCTCHGKPVEAEVPCPRCRGTGRKLVYSRGNEPSRQDRVPRGNGWHDEKRDHQGKNFAPPTPTDEPCPACGGEKSSIDLVWPDEVLDAWPRRPCVVGDMFAGSGTTGRAALPLGRSAVLIDLNPDYCELMAERMAALPGDVEQVRGGQREEDEIEPEDEAALQLSLEEALWNRSH